MNELMYSFRDNNVRVVMKENEPWFVAKDVCNILGLENVTRAVERLKDKNKGLTTNQGSKVLYELNIINEAGLYQLIFSSRKEEAEAFKDWVFEEVLPSIRKNGLYATEATAEKILNDPDFLIKALQQLKEEREERKRAEELIEQQKPKVLFANAVSGSDNSILIRDLAKLITQNGVKIGQNTLYKWLIDNKYIISKGENKTPMQRYVEQGLFEIRETVINTSNGCKLRLTTKVTGKGQQYFINKFLKECRL